MYSSIFSAVQCCMQCEHFIESMLHCPWTMQGNQVICRPYMFTTDSCESLVVGLYREDLFLNFPTRSQHCRSGWAKLGEESLTVSKPTNYFRAFFKVFRGVAKSMQVCTLIGNPLATRLFWMLYPEPTASEGIH
jgi:hypothetical protein